MKKTIYRMLMLVMAAAWSVAAMAQDPAVPGITMFYPGENPESPMELKATATAYIYFESGSHIVTAKAQVIQDGETLGTCVYRPTMPGGSTVQMKPTLDENAVMADIAPGLFTISLYEVVYTVDGTDYTYSDPAAPLAAITYRRGTPDGRLVSETGMPNNTVLSYYAEDDMDGVKTFTFDKPLVPTGISASYSYGMGTSYRTTPLPCSLSDDGLTITVDVRGKCYNVATLAPGMKFYDDNGNPVDPPASISMIVSGLKCVDGSQVSTVSTSLEGNFSTTVTGMIHRTSHYHDLTFPTPVLKSALFYNSAAPAEKYPSLVQGVDRMQLTITDAKYIASCAVEFSAPGISLVVPADEVQLKAAAGTLECAVPAGIFDAESSNVSIGLVDVVYTTVDGADHYIAPLRLNITVNRANNLAELKAYAPNSAVRLTVQGMKVTYAEDNGYCFAEDETAGIQIITPDYSVIFATGQVVNGSLPGTYLGDNIYLVDTDNADYGTGYTDVETGAVIESLDELVSGTYDCRLVTLRASESMPLANDSGMGMVGDAIPVITDLMGDEYMLPDELLDVTGILYYEADMNMYMVIVRTADDINRGLTGVTRPGVDTAVPGAVYDLRGVSLPSADGHRGILIIDGRKVMVK